MKAEPTVKPLDRVLGALARLDRHVDRDRVRTYALILAVLYVAIIAAWCWSAVGLVDTAGKPLGYDFMTFYSAGQLALEGNPLRVFNITTMFTRQGEIAPGNLQPFLWHYPPTYLLAVTPFALLPYLPAYLAFMLVTLACYIAFVRSFDDRRIVLLLALVLPAGFLNAYHGQNAFLTTALLGFGLLLVEKRPVLAGICIGLLAIKPHIAILVPFAFAAGGYWRAFFAAALTASLFCLAATFAFGFDFWETFLANFHVVSRILEVGWLPWVKMPTVYAFTRLLGLPNALALGLQFAGAAAALLVVVRAWHRPGPLDLKASLLILATLFVSPYFFDYDLVLLAVPLWALGRRVLDGSAEPGTKAAMAMAAMAPLFMSVVALITHLQLMPFAIALLGLLVWRRLAAERAGEEASAPAAAPHGTGLIRSL